MKRPWSWHDWSCKDKGKDWSWHDCSGKDNDWSWHDWSWHNGKGQGSNKKGNASSSKDRDKDGKASSGKGKGTGKGPMTPPEPSWAEAFKDRIQEFANQADHFTKDVASGNRPMFEQRYSSKGLSSSKGNDTGKGEGKGSSKAAASSDKVKDKDKGKGKDAALQKDTGSERGRSKVPSPPAESGPVIRVLPVDWSGKYKPVEEGHSSNEEQCRGAKGNTPGLVRVGNSDDKDRSVSDVKQEVDDERFEEGLLHEDHGDPDPFCMEPPSPWLMIYDYNLLRHYYWHPVTKKSSWKPPPGSQLVSGHSVQGSHAGAAASMGDDAGVPEGSSTNGHCIFQPCILTSGLSLFGSRAPCTCATVTARRLYQRAELISS